MEITNGTGDTCNCLLDLIEKKHNIQMEMCGPLIEYIKKQIPQEYGYIDNCKLRLDISCKMVKDEMFQLEYIEVVNYEKDETVMCGYIANSLCSLCGIVQFENLQRKFVKDLPEDKSIHFIYNNTLLRFLRYIQTAERLCEFSDDEMEEICKEYNVLELSPTEVKEIMRKFSKQS